MRGVLLVSGLALGLVVFFRNVGTEYYLYFCFVLKFIEVKSSLNISVSFPSHRNKKS